MRGPTRAALGDQSNRESTPEADESIDMGHRRYKEAEDPEADASLPFALRQRTRGGIATVVKHEADAVASLAAFDFADEQQVISGAVLGVVAAFEPRHAAFDQRRARGADPIRHASEAIGVRA